MRNRQKKLIHGIWLLAAMLAACLLLRILSVASLWTDSTADRENNASLTFRLKNSILSAAFQTCLPGVYYRLFESDADDGAFSLIRLCELQWQPSAVYVGETQASSYTAESAVSSAVIRSLSDSETEHAASQAEEEVEETENTKTESPAESSRQSPGGQSAENAPAPTESADSLDAQNTSADALLRHSTVRNPVYTAAQLSDFDYLLNNLYTLDATTTIDASLLNAETLLSEDLRLAKDSNVPQILIYHTHSQEDFADSTPGDASTSIVAAGDYLTSLLTEVYGYNVIHDTQTYDLADGTLDRNKAYTLALQSVGKILTQYPTIEVVIDLHRDGISGAKMTTMQGGKETAPLMFFNGLSRTVQNGTLDSLPNPYIKDNLAFSLQMKCKAEQYYPGVTRPIYLKGYRYNMHLRPRCLLVEAGSQKNTLQEEYNAMEVLADVLDMVLSGED